MTNTDYEQSLALKDKVLADKEQELLVARNQVLLLQDELKNQQTQLEFFKKQLFGPKSERHRLIDDRQLALFELSKEKEQATPTVEVEIAAHKRRSKKQRDGSEVTEKGLRFDADVPVNSMELKRINMKSFAMKKYIIWQANRAVKLCCAIGIQ